MLKSRLLVTGSRGVLGHAVRAVVEDYPAYEFVFVSSRDADLRSAAATEALFRSVSPDAVLHLAAVSGGVTLGRSRPATLLRDNVLMTFSVLEAARTTGVRKLVMTLSSGMYPPSATVPYLENQIHQGPAHESNFSYAYAKRLIDPAVRSYATEYRVNAISLVPNGIFGEHDNYTSDGTTFIAALISRFYEARGTSEPIVVWGDGTPLRELTYGRDMARAFMWALEHYDNRDPLNVGTPEEHSIKDIACAIADELGIDRARIVFDPSKPGGVARKSVDTSRFASLSNFRFTPLREGIRLTLRWFAAHRDQSASSDKAGQPQ